MSVFNILSTRLSAIHRRTERECEIDEELRFHLEMRTQENINAGMTGDEARRDAVERFGDLAHIKTMCQKVGGKNRHGLKALKLLLWMVAGIGLTLRLTTSIHAVQPIGNTLIMIAVLSRLLIYVRSMRPGRYARC